jgi:hypothetical protein
MVLIYMREAFLLSIKDLAMLGGWTSFDDGGAFSDEEINDLFIPLINDNREKWDENK